MWKIGDKAYCINDKGLDGYQFPNGKIKEGTTYVVEGHVWEGNKLGLQIMGKPVFHQRRMFAAKTLCTFDARRFKKIVLASQRVNKAEHSKV